MDKCPLLEYWWSRSVSEGRVHFSGGARLTAERFEESKLQGRGPRRFRGPSTIPFAYRYKIHDVTALTLHKFEGNRRVKSLVSWFMERATVNEVSSAKAQYSWLMQGGSCTSSLYCFFWCSKTKEIENNKYSLAIFRIMSSRKFSEECTVPLHKIPLCRN